ncbi:MAG: TatD family hydrolase [Bacilli bacterium]|nr:TatD family hydrolase [Bacilli bacterium]MDY6363087.1 TatD family hydrolase [Bacilli bacterium]
MIDSHCHINDPSFKDHPEEYINLAKSAGIAEFLVVGYDEKSSRIAVDIAKKYPECFAAVGIHPSDVKRMEKGDLESIEELAKNARVLAIGEIGLDYYWDKEKEVQDQQKEFFIKQIDIANKLNKPISIHCRDAYEDCYEILKAHPVNKGGVMHCYGGSPEMAKMFIKLGFVLGFGGTLTFKNARKPKEVLESISDKDYILETDAPYLAPDPYRGKQNHSKYLYLVRDKIAELRNISAEEVDRHSTENFNRIFR